MGSNSYSNVNKKQDYDFYDWNNSMANATNQASNMANYGKEGMTQNMGASAGLVNQAVSRAGTPQAWMQEFTSQVAPGIYQAFGDMNNRTGYAGSLFNLADNVGQRAQLNAAQGFAGGALNSGAAQFARQKAIADAQLQAQNTASGMLTQTLGAGLNQGMGLAQQNYNQGTNQILQGAQQFGQNAAQYGNLYQGGANLQGQLAGQTSGIVKPMYVKDKNWFDYSVEGLNAAGSAASGAARLMNPMANLVNPWFQPQQNYAQPPNMASYGFNPIYDQSGRMF